MGENSHIEWCDHTWNGWEGCTKVSPGCAHCYAEARNQRFAGGANLGKGAPRRRTSVHNWNEPRRWNRDCEKFRFECAGCGLRYSDPDALGRPWICVCGKEIGSRRRPRVFCASLADWLDDEVPIEWLADLLALVHECRNLDWLLLTKRPENWRTRILAAAAWATMNLRDELRVWLLNWVNLEIAPENVWLGTTVEDQQRVDERIPLLLSIPAKVRFLSCEPLLGPVDLDKWMFHPTARTNISGINWIICGGESGPKARPMQIKWAESLLSQCQAASVPFFMKQMGGVRKPFPEIPTNINVREFPQCPTN